MDFLVPTTISFAIYPVFCATFWIVLYVVFDLVVVRSLTCYLQELIPHVELDRKKKLRIVLMSLVVLLLTTDLTHNFKTAVARRAFHNV